MDLGILGSQDLFSRGGCSLYGGLALFPQGSPASPTSWIDTDDQFHGWRCVTQVIKHSLMTYSYRQLSRF